MKIGGVRRHEHHGAGRFNTSGVIYPALIILLILLTGCDNNSGNNGDTNPKATTAPLNLVATGQLNNVLLTWDPVPGASTYNVYMATESGLTTTGFATLANGTMHTGVTATQFSPPATLQYDTTYYFIVTAVNGKGESAASLEVSAIPFTDTPATLLSAPAISAAPDPEKTQASVLSLTTDMDTRVAVDLASDDHTLHINFTSFGRTHTLPLAGMRSGKSYTATVKVINRGGTQTDAENGILFFTDSLPNGFPDITVTSTPALMEPGYTLFNLLPHGNTNNAFGQLLVMVDEQGHVVWHHRFSDQGLVNAVQKDDGTLLVMIGNTLTEMDLLGNRHRQWQAVGEVPGSIATDAIPVKTRMFHHEVFPMASGNFLSLSLEVRKYANYPTNLFDLENGATKNANVVGDIVVEFAPDGSIVKQWRLLDMLDPYRLGYDSLWDFYNGEFGFTGYEGQPADSVAFESDDWAHANAVLEDAAHDAIIVSLRHQDAIVKFRRSTGELVWILGPHDNWDPIRFGKYLLTPTTNQQYFFAYHPHAPALLPNGNILVYDNGNWRASPPNQTDVMYPDTSFSRGVEYAIDEGAMTVAQVWAYGEGISPQVFSPFLGNADKLPNTGNVLLTHGSMQEYFTVNTDQDSLRFSAQVVEVGHDELAPEVFHMTVTDPAQVIPGQTGWRIYRALRVASPYGNQATVSVTKR